MKIKRYFVFFILFFILLNSCQSKKKNNENADIQESAVFDSINFKNENFNLNTKNNLEKTGRKFIRSADVKLKVKNVQSSTEKIEDLTAKYNGYIINSNLQNQIYSTSEIAISKDSSLLTKSYIVENNITIKIPNAKLDSLLRELNRIVQFLDYRVIKAEDVSLQFLSNSKEIKRLDTYEKRVTKAIDQKGKKLDETNTSENDLLEKQTQNDRITIKKLSLEDEVAFSTIQIHIYQNESKFKEIVSNRINYESIRPYRENLFTRIGDALIDSWYIFEEILLFFTKVWYLILGGILIIIFYQKRKNNKK